MPRTVQQDASNPICEGSGVVPIVELGFCTTGELSYRVNCPGCGVLIAVNRRTDQIRKHRRELAHA